MRVIRFSFLILLTAGIFASCSKQEKVSPAEETIYSSEALSILKTFEEHNAKSDFKVTLNKKDIQDAMDGEGPNRMPCAASDGCCFNDDDLALLLDNFGCTSGCPTAIDLNCDGVINTADLLILLAYYGCPDVDVIIGNQSGTNTMTITDMLSSQLRNYTTIDGTFWSSSDPTITQARWYVNGVAITSNIPSFQFEYPGATEYDYAVPCNGYYLVTLAVEVECKIYETTECFRLYTAGLPTCAENGCE